MPISNSPTAIILMWCSEKSNIFGRRKKIFRRTFRIQFHGFQGKFFFVMWKKKFFSHFFRSLIGKDVVIMSLKSSGTLSHQFELIFLAIPNLAEAKIVERNSKIECDEILRAPEDFLSFQGRIFSKFSFWNSGRNFKKNYSILDGKFRKIFLDFGQIYAIIFGLKRC